jgi:hypothetical protein
MMLSGGSIDDEADMLVHNSEQTSTCKRMQKKDQQCQVEEKANYQEKPQTILIHA